MPVTEYKFPPQYNTIKDFDIYETCQYKITEYLYRKQLQSTQTKTSEASKSYTIIEVQNEKNKKQRAQASFHQKIFDQHIECVEKNLCQFLEKSFPQFETLPKQILLRHIYGEDSDPTQSTQKLNQLLQKDNKYFDQKQRNKFLTILFYEEPLYDFLSLLCNLTHSQLALQLVFVSSLFCGVHAEKQQKNLNQDQIEKLVDDALESDNFSEQLSKLQLLTLRRCRIEMEICQEQLEHSIKKLIRVFGNTIILVMEEYFINKFSKLYQSPQVVKRSFNLVDISNDEYSDEENEFYFSVGKKKCKA